MPAVCAVHGEGLWRFRGGKMGGQDADNWLICACGMKRG